MDSTLFNIFYLSGLSLRQVEKTLHTVGVERSREAVRKWIHRFGSLSLEILAPKASRGVAVVDETCIKLGVDEAWLWVAIDPYNRAFLAFQITSTRNIWLAYSFLKGLEIGTVSEWLLQMAVHGILVQHAGLGLDMWL